ncbi:MAG: aminoglycoside phosphotransferase family protein [Ilumatobacteraceae bacterium]|nr:aminoglycoside phosphotransferase family protein [Ilumatobacteraceae bacterium]
MADRPYVDQPVGDPTVASAAAHRAAQELGLTAPVLVRIGMNGIFRCGDVALRVGRPTAEAASAIALAGALRQHGIRVPRPMSDQAVRVGDVVVTAWEHVEPSGGAVDWRAVGEMLAVLHHLDVSVVPPGYPLPSPTSFPWWDFDALIAEVADEIDEGARDGLRACIDRHRDWHQVVRRDPSVCHGDVHPGNVLQTTSGPVLLDWDLLCIANPAWDHAPMLTWAERWGGPPGEYEALAEGLGADLRGDPDAAALAELRLVAATVLRVRAGRTDPAAAAEAERRLRLWRGEVDPPVWRAQ